MTRRISDIVPDPEDFIALEPEMAGGVILDHLNSLTDQEREQLNRYNFTLPGAQTFAGYPPQHTEKIRRVIMEGWMWLEREGLIAPQPGKQGDWFFVTRRGEQMKFRSDLTAYRPARLEVLGAPGENAMEWDVFICHAGEDKGAVVEPLAHALKERGVKVWYDRWILSIGDSLREKIDEGLKKSRYGVVVLSPAFFGKGWPEWELDGLVQREVQGRKVILPVWHEVTREDVSRYSLPLAGKVAGSTARGVTGLADEIIRAIDGDAPSTSAIGPPPKTSVEKFVDADYPKDSGLLAQLQAAGYEVKWRTDGQLHRALDIEGWEYASQDLGDGRQAILKLQDRLDNLTLIKKLASQKP